MSRPQESTRRDVDPHTEDLDALANQSAAACKRLNRGHIQGWLEWLPIEEIEEELA